MKTRTTKNKPKPTKGMGNPATVAAVSTLATSKTGQGAISTVGNVAKWVIIIGVVGGVSYAGYKIYQKRFVKMAQARNQPVSNITSSEARLKADNLYNAMYGFSANYDMVKAQLLGLNYNAFVMVYNAFGKRPSKGENLNPLNIFSFGNNGMTLTEWLLDQFKSSSRLTDLRILLPGKFI